MRKTILTSPHATYAAQVIVLATLYLGAARIGLLFAIARGQVTLVYPPAGIALAALLLFGYRLWPGVALGMFLGLHR